MLEFLKGCREVLLAISIANDEDLFRKVEQEMFEVVF
jgi:hypothetical protein